VHLVFIVGAAIPKNDLKPLPARMVNQRWTKANHTTKAYAANAGVANLGWRRDYRLFL
jgi:hypothetical protein